MSGGESSSKTKQSHNREILTAYIMNAVRTSYYFMFEQFILFSKLSKLFISLTAIWRD